MNKKVDVASPYGVTRDVLVQNDILRFEVATLKKANTMVEKSLKDQAEKMAELEKRLELMQSVLDAYALSTET